MKTTTTEEQEPKQKLFKPRKAERHCPECGKVWSGCQCWSEPDLPMEGEGKTLTKE